jgi:uncharacterized protein (UPF0333 family)
MSKKAQAATEFLILFMILLAALTVAMYMTIQRSSDLTSTKIGLESMNVLNDASSKINIAFLEGDGFMINLTLPDQIFGRNYTSTIQSNYISLLVVNITYSKALLTENITGSLNKGINLVENKNGVVVIS